MKKIFIALLFCLLFARGSIADYDNGGITQGERVVLNTEEFDNNLSSADTDVQKALDTLDNLILTSSSLSALADVSITSISNNQLIKYNSTSGKWENWSPNYLTSYTETDPIWTADRPSYSTTAENNLLYLQLTGGTITGDLNLSNTTHASQFGIITKSGNRFVHDFNYGNNGTVTTDGFNTFIGVTSGNFTMGSTATHTYDSSRNTGGGYNVLSANTLGYYNSGWGADVLASNTIGYSNSGFGFGSQNGNTGGYGNSSFGVVTLFLNTLGYNNSAFGYFSLRQNTLGYQNSAYGAFSGSYIADGVTPNQTSDNSVYLGCFTKALANGDTNEIILGYNATGAGSNTAVLGNDNIVKTLLKGTVAIGTTDTDGTPAIGRLIVQATTNEGSTNAQVWRDSDGVNLTTLDSNGNFTSGGNIASGTGIFKFNNTNNINIDGANFYLLVQNTQLVATSWGVGAGWTTKSPAADGAATIGHVFKTVYALNTAGAKLASFQNQTTEKAYIDKDGGAYFAGGITANGYNNSNWDTAYSWGDHASAGYLSGTVAVGSGGTGITTIAAGSILAANSADNLSVVNSISGTKYLKNVDGTISWETIAAGGDVVGPATNTADYVPQWNGTDSKTLKDGLVVGGASGLASLNASSKVVQDPANATATPTASKIVIADASGYVNGWIQAASDTVSGKVELATTVETDTGTDTGRAVTPDGLAGSIFGTKTVVLKIIADDTALSTGDGKMYFTIPEELNGMNLVSAQAHVYTVSSSGTPTFAIYNLTDNHDMLSVNITIDANEKDSSTAATAPTIDTTYDDVATADEIRIDCDVAGTGTKGAEIRLSFRKP